jgi:antirestriction protein ArdC
MSTIYHEVTNSIIEQLEKGAAPWIKPWSADSTADKNIVSQKPYAGINRLILGMSSMCQSFNTPVWGSFKQWQALGASVRKGEKGTKIIFYSPVTKENKATGDSETYNLIKAYFVFNASQVDGIEITPVSVPDTPFNSIYEAEQRIAKTGAIISHGGDAAFFSPSLDKIQLPNKVTFQDAGSYYATAFHELTHWTSAKTRLDRTLGTKFGNPEYAFEELVAEMGAAFLCQDYRIKGELRHAGYIQHWLKACRSDDKAIFKASALAQKAANYINLLDEQSLAIAA